MRIRISLVLLVGISIFFRVRADDPGLGCTISSDDELRGIPLASTPFSGADLPPSVDLSAKCPPPGDQMHQNSCVAWALAYALKSYEEVLADQQPCTNSNGDVDLNRVFSPSFIYNQINHGRDGGCDCVDALNVLSQQGAVSLNDMPYSERDYLTQPSPSLMQKAAKFRIDTWRRVNIADIKEVKAQLNAAYPVVIAAYVDDGFIKLGPQQKWQNQIGEVKGGHAMLLVGYDDSRSAFKVLNSWGRNWGDGGYGWIDYSYFPRVVQEGFVAKDAAHGPAPEPQPQPEPPPQPSPLPGPTPPPLPEGYQISILNVQQNQVVAPYLGAGLVILGNATVPPGATGSLQIVTQFYLVVNNQKYPIGSSMPAYATFQGLAASSTPPTPIGSGGWNGGGWHIFFPYNALNLTRGFQMGSRFPVPYSLVAETTIFVDNFGVAAGPEIPFTVNL